MATWKSPLQKIVISEWLRSIADSLGEKAVCIPNGLDFEAFGIDIPPEDRQPDSILMLHHTLAWKGTGDGILALERVRKRYPEALIQLFGTEPAPAELPAGFRYHRNPPQLQLRALYNEAAIFLGPSLSEGWGLPPAEAMMSGCALVATDIGGHREYAIPEETALLSAPGDPDGLAGNAIRLIGDSRYRVRLARAGRSHIERFTWTRALDAFEGVLRGAS
jgi:glycosyltransferase involved in cell wall biosynthesis